MNLTIRACNAAQLPTALLLEADPHLPYVQAYLADGHCYLAELDDLVVGLYVLRARGPGILELMNIAVVPNCQAQGIGTQLLQHALHSARQLGAMRLEVATGSFGHQLTFYQRAGLRVYAVEPDYFLRHYPEPLFEQGLQHKDRLRLAIDLN
ncbi:GNAT family N-acetyltransferase [Pseudomonas sp. HMWF032]|uniref:GNAT family N-acetyltransferase n=1 Tax=Pseudomonas sp. HMWF032 TaxID=2056866 RepID=UPI000D38742C|nr:GNAT family N-acetyltransferase [Pseudomonas sp. HMWF032]PTS84939.1 GNAT family N-acetyltransferase [Pseudomonas sp. HMWF032]PTT85195.1 GNAT family N-acetyltransferase [Pseudomonas sp. HMWF010]